jgi:hypothetical protein
VKSGRNTVKRSLVVTALVLPLAWPTLGNADGPRPRAADFIGLWEGVDEDDGSLAQRAITCDRDRTCRVLGAIYSLDRRNGTLIEDTDGEPATLILHRLSPRCAKSVSEEVVHLRRLFTRAGPSSCWHRTSTVQASAWVNQHTQCPYHAPGVEPR